MIEIKCSNCGSPSLRRKGNYWICEHCGSKYIYEDNASESAKKIGDDVSYDYPSTKARFLNKDGLRRKAWKELYLDYEPWIRKEYYNNFSKCSREQRAEWRGAIDSCHQEMLHRLSSYRLFFAVMAMVTMFFAFVAITSSLFVFVLCFCATAFDIFVFIAYGKEEKRIRRDSVNVHARE